MNFATVHEKPPIAITMGDPAGVGPEICLHLLANREIIALCTPVVFGDASVLREVAKHVGLLVDTEAIPSDQWTGLGISPSKPVIVDLGIVGQRHIRPGMLDPVCGEAAFRYVEAAIAAGLAGKVRAVSTAPLNKEALHLAGHRFPGHTEIFAERMSAPRSCMMQYSEAVTCTFATVHIGYAEVPQHLTTERIVDVIELTDEALRRIRGRQPKLLVCGLNPHAGENGLFGNREEERVIMPAIEIAKKRGFDVLGPVPADTAFTPARRAEFDAVVCMYHDQGHIPVKMISFDCAVNTTLGLPVLRTSVDHGTAFDIAWTGKASPNSLFAAVKLAAKLTS